MKNTIRSAARLYQRRVNRYVVIHVGKCGGGSLKDAMRSIGLTFSEVHIRPFSMNDGKKRRCIILLRNPIARALSAFNWRKRIVISEQKQTNRFPGEERALKNWESLNSLAEALYDKKGALVESVASDFESIHHLRESIHFYFSDVSIRDLHKSVAGVLLQESLGEDFKRIFHSGAKLPNQKRNRQGHMHLSVEARNNLAQYLERDYEVIRELYKYNLLNEEQYSIAMEGGIT